MHTGLPAGSIYRHVFLPLQHFHNKIMQDLKPGQTAVAEAGQPVSSIIFGYSFIHYKCICKFRLHQLQSGGKLAAVIVNLHHILHTFQLQHLPKGQPSGGNDFVWRLCPVCQSVLCRHGLHMGAFQHLQESQLQLLRLHLVYFIEGAPETVIILIGQTCNQIQVLMDIMPRINPGYYLLHPF